jgi:photosystem I subunit 3
VVSPQSLTNVWWANSVAQIPGIGFLYVAGWIGYAGRDYVQWAKTAPGKPTEKEIIIDVPVAIGMMFNAASWPLAAFNELKNGSLTEDKENITVSPR